MAAPLVNHRASNNPCQQQPLPVRVPLQLWLSVYMLGGLLMEGHDDVILISWWWSQRWCHCDHQGRVFGPAGGHLPEQRPQLPPGSLWKTKIRKQKWNENAKVPYKLKFDPETLHMCRKLSGQADPKYFYFYFCPNLKCYLYHLVFNRNTTFSSYQFIFISRNN